MGYVPSSYNGLLIPDGNEEPDVPADLAEFEKNMKGRLTQPFSSWQARDTAVNALTASQRRGAITFVDDAGWAGNDGQINRPFSMRGVTFVSGTKSVGTNSVGLFSISHELEVEDLHVECQHLYGPGADAALARASVKIREKQMNNVIFWLIDTTTGNGIANESLFVQYRFEKYT